MEESAFWMTLAALILLAFAVDMLPGGLPHPRDGELLAAEPDSPIASNAWKSDVDILHGGQYQGRYSDFSKGGRFGFWGLLEDLRDPGSVRWDTAMSLVLPAGDTTLDGIVTYEDYLVLEANFDQSERWWEQGDTNADNTVNGEDLINLYANIQDLTPLQDQRIHDFADRHGIVIPEPSSGLLATLGLLTYATLVAARKRRQEIHRSV